MSFRFSLLLLIVGAAIIFLVDSQSQGVDIRVLGFVFVAGGILGCLLAIGRGVARRVAKRAPEADLMTDVDERRKERLRDRV